jgi:hypothetical protein
MNRNQNNARFACYQKDAAPFYNTKVWRVLSVYLSQCTLACVCHEKLPIIYANIRV